MFEIGVFKSGSADMWKNYFDLIDEINEVHSLSALALPEFSISTTGIHLYDICIAFERGRNISKRDLQTGSR